MDYRLHAVTAKYDLSADEQKVEFLKEATELVARLPGAVERQVYAMRVASLSGVAADAVTAEVERRRKRLLSGARRANAPRAEPSGAADSACREGTPIRKPRLCCC